MKKATSLSIVNLTKETVEFRKIKKYLRRHSFCGYFTEMKNLSPLSFNILDF